MILCLVGSESEAEVSAKFDQTPGMKLGWQHVASSRFGVRAKSDGLRSLAGELGLGLERFVFVTGDPVDAAEVRASLARVVVADLPLEDDAVSAFLANFWVFDQSKRTVSTQRKLHVGRDVLGRIGTEFDTVDAIARAIESMKVFSSETRPPMFRRALRWRNFWLMFGPVCCGWSVRAFTTISSP